MDNQTANPNPIYIYFFNKNSCLILKKERKNKKKGKSGRVLRPRATSLPSFNGPRQALTAHFAKFNLIYRLLSSQSLSKQVACSGLFSKTCLLHLENSLLPFTFSHSTRNQELLVLWLGSNIVMIFVNEALFDIDSSSPRVNLSNLHLL